MAAWNSNGSGEDLDELIGVSSSVGDEWDTDLEEVIAAVRSITTPRASAANEGNLPSGPAPGPSADVDYRVVQDRSLPVPVVPAGTTSGRGPQGVQAIFRGGMTLQYPHRSIRTEGFLWMAGEFFLLQGHVGLTNAAVERMYRWVPPLSTVHDPIPVLLCAFQTLATYRTAESIFRGWADRTNRLIVSDFNRPNLRSPVLTPWNAPEMWTIGTWQLCNWILRRFLRQPSLEEEVRFSEALDDVRGAAGIHSWVIDYAMAVYYFAESNTHLWEVIFSRQE